ncbi:hypothetical protein R1sor_005084 [Riccia sorocarpa]|uniref:Reverse transcriptase domain-containing protein n=1 Tax=Riccia sorocarpa TaxID=122646 RepID=A0ABD3HJ27_9MARC
MERDFILLQLDFRKAFDSVNWRFLQESLRVFNFGPNFQRFIKAILDNAASTILVNGRRSRPVKVMRSVRQGCPLSPLLFILVTQTLTEVINKEVEAGRINGIYLQKANVHYCLGLYADDSHAIFEATKDCVVNIKGTLDTFANASGLQIQWQKSAARWIGPRADSLPDWVDELEWSWKHRGENTKLLGFTFEEGINAGEMLRRCKLKVNEICSNPAFAKLSIYGRVTVANASLLGAFWYIVPLWAGELCELEKIEKQVVNFVWSGASLETRNRIATKVVIQKVKEGGLGLLSLTKQYTAFTARTIRWAYQAGEHPLQLTIRRMVEEENIKAFGVPGAQWLYTPARSQGSTDGVVRKVNSLALRRLWEEGYRTVGDLTKADSEQLACWDHRKIKGAEQKTVQRAFQKLTIRMIPMCDMVSRDESK